MTLGMDDVLQFQLRSIVELFVNLERERDGGDGRERERESRGMDAKPVGHWTVND
jgi:hypothetical protein